MNRWERLLLWCTILAIVVVCIFEAAGEVLVAAWGRLMDGPPERPRAPAMFTGWWESEEPDGEAIELYELTADIEGHRRGGQVSRRTLERAGYFVPPRPAPVFCHADFSQIKP